jgi:dipeptidase E
MKIVANGGLGPTEKRRPIDRFSIDFSGAEKPSVLLIPTPKASPDTMRKSIKKAVSHFAELGVSAEALYTDFDTPPSRDEVAHKIGQASIINVSGGDTLRAMERFRLWGIDEELIKAAKNDTVLTGTSAGAICWFTKGHSDSMSYRVTEGEPWEYTMVDALDIEPGIVIPHYNTNTENGEARLSNFARMVHDVDTGSLPIYGIDNRAAIVVDGHEIASITVDDSQRVHTIGSRDGLPYGTLDVLR